MFVNRRSLLTGIASLMVGAPAIVRASSLMPIKVVGWTTPLRCRQMSYGNVANVLLRDGLSGCAIR